jgi:hypothetical protein
MHTSFCRSHLTRQTLRRAAEKEQLQDADLNKIVTITLTETDTVRDSCAPISPPLCAPVFIARNVCIMCRSQCVCLI